MAMFLLGVATVILCLIGYEVAKGAILAYGRKMYAKGLTDGIESEQVRQGLEKEKEDINFDFFEVGVGIREF